MANGTIGFFEPQSSITVPACWTFQDGGAVNNSRTRASELGRTGDEIKKKLHDHKAETSFVYLLNITTGAISWPKVGAVSGGWHIDGFSAGWDRDSCAPKMTVNCHKHTGGSNHAANSCRTYTPSLVVNAQDFGCPSDFGDAFALDAQAVVDLRDATYSCQCTHTDENGRSGEFLKGDNNDGVETLTVNLTGNATSDDYSTTWDATSDSTTPSNSGVTTSSITLEHHLSADVAATTP